SLIIWILSSILWILSSILWILSSILWILSSILWILSSILWILSSILWILSRSNGGVLLHVQQYREPIMPYKCLLCDTVLKSQDDSCGCPNPQVLECVTVHFMHPRAKGI